MNVIYHVRIENKLKTKDKIVLIPLPKSTQEYDLHQFFAKQAPSPVLPHHPLTQILLHILLPFLNL